MRLYLVRHGEAEAKAIDPARSLTERGRGDVARVAAFAQRAGVEVYQIRHSGKRRAEETAAILTGYLEPAGGSAYFPGLSPGDDVRPIAEALIGETRSLMFVGHNPFQERLAALLLTGDRKRPVVGFQMGTIACLERRQRAGDWLLCWMVTPDIVRVR